MIPKALGHGQVTWTHVWCLGVVLLIGFVLCCVLCILYHLFCFWLCLPVFVIVLCLLFPCCPSIPPSSAPLIDGSLCMARTVCIYNTFSCTLHHIL